MRGYRSRRSHRGSEGHELASPRESSFVPSLDVTPCPREKRSPERSCALRSRWILGALLSSVTLLPGCLQPKQGAGPPQAVTLMACQTAAPYLVALAEWNAEQSRRLESGRDASDTALMEDEGFLAPHRLSGDHVTPTLAYKPEAPYVAVFKREGQKPQKYGPFVPPTRIEVCFPGCEPKVAFWARPPAPQGRGSR